jgi:ubiquinone/menaquinone biosynthesis C-methylase UbiE
MFTNPVKNLKAFAPPENGVVADLGAGTGFYTLALGHLVPRGKVYAIELHKDYLSTIQNKVKEAHLQNVDILWGNVEKMGGTKIRDEVADGAIASDILFQVEDKDTFINEIKRILKPGGRVLLVDWMKSPIFRGAVVPKEKAREMFEKKGFKLEREIDAGDYHYGMILVRN